MENRCCINYNRKHKQDGKGQAKSVYTRKVFLTMAYNVISKPKQNFSLHTHTIGFDGQNTPAAMVAGAQYMCIEHLGISNHFIVHPNITRAKFYPFALERGYSAIYSSGFDEAIAKFKQHYAELNQKKLQDFANDCDVKIYRGMEVDFFDYPEWQSGFERALNMLQPDYVICASHFVEYDSMLCNVHDFANVDDQARDDMLKLYWEKLGRAAETGLFNFMAHLDLPKKTGVGTEEKWAEYEQMAIDKIAKSKTPIEINTSFYNRNRDEPYPSARILKMAAAANIPVIISDDAHRAEHIGRYFDRADGFARACGINNFLTCDMVLRKTR